MVDTVAHKARYLYPGVFMPEEQVRDLTFPTYGEAVKGQPDDGWYAVEISSIKYKRFTADDGDIEWIPQGTVNKETYIIGQQIHCDEIPNTDENRILRSNIRSNSDDGFAVKTRCGNWQIASDWDHVMSA